MDENYSTLLQLIKKRDSISEKVIKAMEKFDRKDFVPEQFKSDVYIDLPLPTGYGQTISQPSLVVFMTEKLNVKEKMKVLEIGSGSGWQACILSALVGAKGKVITVERIFGLCEFAKENAAKYKVKNIEFICSSELPDDKFDRIIVTAAAESLPKKLFDQLKEGGKMLIPIGGPHYQELMLIEKIGGKMAVTTLIPVQFVPLIGSGNKRA